MPSPSVTITLLVNNHAGEGLVGEHGLSLWIETADTRILFDTGQSDAFVKNARVLGVHLERADSVVLSHGHYDHTGGIAHAFRLAHNAQVYCHPGVVLPRYSIQEGLARTIAMPQPSLEALDKLPPRRLHWVQSPVRLSDRIGITGPIPRRTDFEDVGGPFYLDPEGRRADPIDDDLALWIHTDEGLVVCVGCCHAGLINALEYVRLLNPDAPLRAVIGGFHLVNADRRRLEETLTALREFNLEQIVPCHCTGDAAVTILHKALGDCVLPSLSGMQYQYQIKTVPFISHF